MLGPESSKEQHVQGSVVVVVDAFPELSETFVVNEVRALVRLGCAVRVLAWHRPRTPASGAADGLDVTYLEDDGRRARLRDLAWLALRRPRRCLADLAARRRWRREEVVPPMRVLAPAARRIARHRDRHLHAHFATGPALTALRLSRITGVPFSVTAHAYDIFERPANLAAKLGAAAFATTGCTYNVEHLRRLPGLPAGSRIERIVMGVDGAAFRRTRPHPGPRVVLAVGRLVEKKGFGDLVAAAARLPPGELERLDIVGDGPLREELAAQAAREGVADRVRLLGARQPAEVRRLLEEAAVLAMPCVVARDGDRDSMPVVVKEALAMELPVVATDEVGLPEIVREPWGTLVPPHDPGALAAALAAWLARSPDERAAAGRAGREAVLRECDLERETARLLALIGEAGRTPRR